MKKLLTVFVILLWANSACALSRHLVTIKPSGGDYTSLQAAIAGEAGTYGDLVSSDIYIDFEIDGSWSSDDTSKVTISSASYTTDATHVINIYTTSTARPDRIWSSGSGYRLHYQPGGGSDGTFVSTVAYVTVDGLKIGLSRNADFQQYHYVMSASSNATIKNNVFYFRPANLAQYAVATVTAGTNSIAYNNSLHCQRALTGEGLDMVAGTSYNNTVYGCYNGIIASSGSTVKNNIAYNNTSDYAGTFTTSSNNLSKDTTSPDASYRSKTLSFVNTTAGSEDLHLVSGDTDAIGQGADLSGIFTTDFDGDTRSSWDIGADEYVSVASDTYSGRGIGRSIMRGVMR